MVQLFPCGLDITAVGATDLAKRKRFGSQDPYLLFHLQGRRKFTCVAVKGGSKPQWNQTIRYRRLNNPATKEDTILKVYCFHEKTGVTIISTDGLIGQCEVDLQETVLKSQDGSFEGVLTLQNDGKACGKDEPEPAETAPIRPERKGVHLFGGSKDKEKDKDSKSSKHSKSQSTSAMSALATNTRPGQKDEIDGDSNGNTFGQIGRLQRPQSLEGIAAHSQAQARINFGMSLHTIHGTQSLDEVRALNSATPVSEGDHSNNTSTASDERSPEASLISSPPQRFISQDDEGNVNQLRLLTAPLDPSWLQPTPPTLRRALSAQYFYAQMQDSQQSPQGYQQQQQQQQGVYPPMADPYQRPISQQAHYPGYNPDTFFNTGFNNGGSGGGPTYNSMSALGPPNQGQQQQQTSQPYPVMESQSTGGSQLYPDPAGYGSQLGLPPGQFPQMPQLPSRSQPAITGTVPYQPHTIFQPRQPNRSRMNNYELNKNASLPSRRPEGRFPDPATMGPSTLSHASGHQSQQQQQQHQQQQGQQQRQGQPPSQPIDFQLGGQLGGVGPAEAASTMAVAAAISAAAAAAAPTVVPKAPDADTLGPACGSSIPDGYSQQSQQRLASIIPAPLEDTTNFQQQQQPHRFPSAYSNVSPTEAAAAATGALGRSQSIHRSQPMHAPSAPPAMGASAMMGAAPWGFAPTGPAGAGIDPTVRSASAGAMYGPGPGPGLGSVGGMVASYPGQARNTGHHMRDETQVVYSSPMAIQDPTGLGLPARPVSRATNDRRAETSMSMASNQQFSHASQWESLDTMTSSPAIPIPTKIPERARDAIHEQFKPTATPWEGRDIQESVIDNSLGRMVVDRYTTGPFREKNVREGLYVNRHQRSPVTTMTTVMRQMSLHRPTTTTKTTGTSSAATASTAAASIGGGDDGEGNDRVILKYSKSRREWEIDNIMVRYLVHTQVNDALENHFAEYRPHSAPQRQRSYEVNPFVVGLYETFLRPLTPENEYRFLSVYQWYPETLQDFIMDCTASGEGLAVTLPVVRTLIECIRWIHDRKICHLNLKPSNFARDPFAASRRSGDGAGWKLIDFESARVMGEEPVGRCTFAYAAPEILRGHLADVPVIAQGAMDIWSLGLVLYEVLTDQPLFHTDDQAQHAMLQAGPHAAGATTTTTTGSSDSLKPIRYYDATKVLQEYRPLLDAMIAQDPASRFSARQLLQMSLFSTPITQHGGSSPHEMVRNNNVLTLRDVQAVRLCNLSLAGSKSEDSGDLATNYSFNNSNNYNNNGQPSPPRISSSLGSHDQMLLEGISRILDSPFHQIPRLFMILPPMPEDLDMSNPLRQQPTFQPSQLLQNRHLRLVLLCEGLSGFGEDAHITDHYGYRLDGGEGEEGHGDDYYSQVDRHGKQEETVTAGDKEDLVFPTLIQDIGKMLLHLVAVAGTNHPGTETPLLDQAWTRTGTPLDNCQPWYPSLRRYYETLQTALQQVVGANPNLHELRTLREPTLKALEKWLVASRRRSPLVGHHHPASSSNGVAGVGGGMPSGVIDESMLVEEVTGPGGGEGYGGLYKMTVGTCGHRWICRGCVSRLMSM
ncbi:Cyclin-dependent kinase-like 3 [Actinomortierella ambigua]|nr:Cyclin-dependent kinase-like 3 [Actinomortierella ambigua]